MFLSKNIRKLSYSLSSAALYYLSFLLRIFFPAIFLKHYSDYHQNDTLIAFLYCFCTVQQNKLSCKVELLANKQIPLIGKVKVACSSSLTQRCFHQRQHKYIFPDICIYMLYMYRPETTQMKTVFCRPVKNSF